MGLWVSGVAECPLVGGDTCLLGQAWSRSGGWGSGMGPVPRDWPVPGAERLPGVSLSGALGNLCPCSQLLSPCRSEFSDTVLSVHPSDVLDMPVDPNEPTYCLCHQVSYGEMIGCDNPDCPIEWFHFACVDLTTKPKGKWFCPRCVQERRKKK
uniref:Inhibitor of growth protein 5 isoform X1-like n=1 Tax=Sus scrofa TaxID=9823 RepID=A0A480NJL6_PIG